MKNPIGNSEFSIGKSLHQKTRIFKFKLYLLIEMAFDIERIREILNEHREQIEKLKGELEKSREKYNALADRIATLSIAPQPVQEPKKEKKEPAVQIDKFQMLMLLKNSKADNSSLAVSAQQIKDSFSIDKTVRTIHNKMLDLKKTGLIQTTGKKPIRYFLTQSGLNLVDQQEKLVFR